uniref:Coiled-coil alpha-helical rod protein 1 n=1 Tax=Xenopus tropicalis TaxID=8364 RepID=A0A6I8RWM5_XENTR
MEKKSLVQPSMFSADKQPGLGGLIPPSHFENRRRVSVPPPSVSVTSHPPICEPWTDLARELVSLRQANEELRKKQEMEKEVIQSRSLHRQPSEGTPSESRALEIIAHQIQEIRRLEIALADAHEKEEQLLKLEQEVKEMDQRQKENVEAEQRRHVAKEAAARQREAELETALQHQKMEAEKLRSRVQELEVELKEDQEQKGQEVVCLKNNLQTAMQEREILADQFSQSQKALDSQNSLVQQLKTYIGELVPDNKMMEEQNRERMELSNTVQVSSISNQYSVFFVYFPSLFHYVGKCMYFVFKALEKERNVLQTTLSLLQTRLSSLTNILSLQENEICKKGVPQDYEKFQHLLSRWREKVFCLMVQLKSEEINKEDDHRKSREKILSLEKALQEKDQEQILLLHTLQDRTAELEMERVHSKCLLDELSAAKAKSDHLASKVEMTDKAVLNLKQLVDSFVQALSAQEITLKGALSRLVTLGQRVSFASKRVDTTQGLVAQRFALLRLAKDKGTRQPSTHCEISQPSYEDLEAEVKLLNEERDRLSAELKRSAHLIESRVAETRERLEAEIAEYQQTASFLRHSLDENEKSRSELKEQLGVTERELQESCENTAELREQLLGTKAEYEKELQRKVNELADHHVQQLAQMEKHLNEARREHTKAVVALRQSERQMQREKTRNQETLRSLEDASRTREEQLSQQLREAERDKNLMIATLRQEGLLNTYQKNRTAAAQILRTEVEKAHNQNVKHASLPGSTYCTTVLV